MKQIESILAQIPRELPPAISEAAWRRWDSLTKPRRSLGRLEEAVVRLAQIQRSANPSMERLGIYVFCGDHGITAERVSPYPSAVTREMVKNFLAGGAAISVLCRSLNIAISVVDTGIAGPGIDGVVDLRIAEGTRNFLHEPAMSRQEAVTAIENGICLAQEAAKKYDMVGVGEMGIGNTTAASALLCAFAGVEPEQAVGRGAGLDDAGVEHKRRIVAQALAHHHERVESRNSLEIAATLGGFEIVTMAGFMLGAAANNLPVMVDGFICGAAFLIAQTFCPTLGEHVFFAHRSAEPGHAPLLSAVQAKPLLDLDLRLGEGTGAALAMGLLRSAVALYHSMATFAEAAVSDRKNKEDQ
jgi:nicotinate-nucleotide--dimethylbenzimidazole phosphoribosyltransferase